MNDLPAIARCMRLPEELLRFPVELLKQGYEPNYLATYRPDELGGLDSKTLAKLKRVVDYETKLAAHKERLTLALQRDDHWSDTVAKVLAECTSISQADAIARNLKIKKSAKAFAESDPNIENLGKAILLYQGEPIKDYTAWAAEQTGLPSEQADELLQKNQALVSASSSRGRTASVAIAASSSSKRFGRGKDSSRTFEATGFRLPIGCTVRWNFRFTRFAKYKFQRSSGCRC